jgi:Cu/Zn superoxide dismutase
MSVATLSLAACSEEDASLLPDGGPLVTAVVGDGGVDASRPVVSIDSGSATPAKLPVESGDWEVFPQDGGAPNPAENIEGTARAIAIDGGMRVTLEVEGLPPEQSFGSHLHKLPCDQMQGGPHYQDRPSTTTPTDPAFANPANEVWFDLETDIDGRASDDTTVRWVPRKGEAKSIVVHERATGDGGVAGGRLACVAMEF